MIGANIVTWRINKQKVPFLAGSKHMYNAFACGTHDAMAAKVAARHDADDAAILEARRRTSAVRLIASDGEATCLLGGGGMMGDGNAPDEFLDNFSGVVDQWREATMLQRISLEVSCAIFHKQKHDGSLFKFVDDLLQFLVVSMNPHDAKDIFFQTEKRLIKLSLQLDTLKTIQKKR